MIDVTERIRNLSPSALDIFKKQVADEVRQGNPEFVRLVSMPELSDIFQPGELPITGQEKRPWYQPILQGLRNIETGFGTFVTAPWTPSVPGTENLPWWQRERAEYEAWEEPSFQIEPLFRLPWTPQEVRARPWTIGAKGAIEQIPWFATTIATLGAGGLGWAGAKTGITALSKIAQVGKTALRPILAVEKGLAWPITKPTGMAVKAITKKFTVSGLPEIARFTALATEEYEKQITKQDWQRFIAQRFGRMPVLKSITEKVGGRAATVTAATEDLTARALLIAPRVEGDLISKGNIALASLRRIDSNPLRLFGVDETTGIAKAIKVKSGFAGASKHIADIAEHPTRYALNQTQKAYIEQLHALEDWVLDGLTEAGVDVKLLKFDDFSHWVHREVVGKNIDDALVKIRSAPSRRIGSKASWEKTRFYETAAEGAKAGILYQANLETVTDLYIRSAARRISHQRIAEMTKGLGKTALERAMAMAPEIMTEARTTAYTLAGAKQFGKVVNRAIRGEKLTEATLRAQERRFPELGARLRNALGKTEELKKLLKDVKAVEEVSKAPYWKAKAERTALMEQARTPTLGTETTIWHPAFQGRIYPKNVGGEIQRYFDDLGWKPLNKLATISGEMRTLIAAADFSAPFIQGLPAMGRYPLRWAKSLGISLEAWANPKRYQEWLVKNMDTLMERANYGGYIGGFEYMEAMPRIQKTFAMVSRLTTGRAEIGRAVARQTYGRFEATFGAFGDALRDELWKALKGRAKNTQELMELARHIDRMTGVMSQNALGIGKSQRAFEQAFMFFAPRYTRAGFALISDAFKGGLTGAETRKALGSMMAAGALMYYGTCKAIGQEPNFDPTTGRFMTIEIKDPTTGVTRHFGVGGMMTALARLGADVTASIIGTGQNEPLDFVKLSRFDNPFIKFLYSRSAPITGLMEGLIFGHNFFGEPFENAGDYALFLSEQVAPIWMQEAYMEQGGFGPTAVAGQLAGVRTFPQSDWEKRNSLRDEVAQRTYGMTWNDVGQKMGELYQRKLENDNPDLQESTQKAQETSSKMARGEGKIWDTWRKEGQAVEDRYRQAITLASQEYEITGDGVTFREKVDDANKVRREMYAMREQDASYADVYAYFSEPLTQAQMDKMNPNDLARREYYQMMYSGDMYDQFGNYRFDEADRREAYFLRKYGQQALDYIKEFMGAKWEEPMAVKILRQARELLKPYWDYESRVWAKPQYAPYKQIADQIEILERTDPQRAKRILFMYPPIVWARKEIARYRKWLKNRNPEIAQALRTFYTY